MDWSQFQRIDPHLLVGLVNTELRNHSDSLDDLCRTHDIDPKQLCAHLASADYHFQVDQRQFR
ncbi:DUF4250 domain-containing protein [Coraliomargarita sp. SDUM461003]|uniref:DUF4250 domain-containing protein n=1 Tax=Thalassobacterium maritimum TaxID=3041265 RepID=A0ABU1APT7_9BACT|nr:DUF4250 domain-containing protein [Coraliomargarita sp. SDUM461003]MDQ8206121.1 DUF4250 domain-containing protein [Coraliomargarita sp. SDUM461003]